MTAHADIRSLTDLLDLSPVAGAEDRFEAPSVDVAGGRIYGGQAVAQAAAAAARTVDDDRPLHSFHGYFLRAGDTSRPVEYRVERVRDGRSFSSRAVRAVQDGRAIFSALASFHVPDTGIEHEQEMVRGATAPEDLPDRFPDGLNVPGAVAVSEDLMQVRQVPVEGLVGLGERATASWIRARHPLPDDPAVHRIALAYLSDAIVQDPMFLGHGLEWGDEGTSMASLDHAVWWYGDGRADEWMLAVQESPIAGRGRGLASGRIYSRDGRILAAVAQEMMVRIHRPR